MRVSVPIRWRTAVWAACLLMSSPVWAIDDLVSTRALGMAEALRANGTGAAALFLNPAGMSLIRQYAMEGNYQYRPEDSAHMASGSIVDSVTSEMAAGVYVHYLNSEPENNNTSVDRDAIEGGLGLSYPISANFLLGVKGKYINADWGPRELSELSVDVGATLRFGGLALGVTGNNLSSAPPEWRKELGLGVGYAFGTTLLLEFDALFDFDKNEWRGRDDSTALRYGGGGELFLGGSYALRGGAIHDSAEDSTWATFGASVFNPEAGLEFGLKQQVDGGEDTLVSFGLKLFMQ